jgi:hypothetical protein
MTDTLKENAYYIIVVKDDVELFLESMIFLGTISAAYYASQPIRENFWKETTIGKTISYYIDTIKKFIKKKIKREDAPPNSPRAPSTKK